MNERQGQTVLKLGAEGGSLLLVMRATGERRQYRVTRDESLFADFEEFTPEALHEESGWVDGWLAALALLDRWSWWRLYPLAIDPDHADLLRSAVLERGGIEAVREWQKRVERFATVDPRSGEAEDR